MVDWTQNISGLQACLASLSVCDDTGKALAPDLAFTHLRTATVDLKRNGKRVYLIGNGASASMASHTATDLSKNALVQAEVFTDLAILTALANDLCYEEVFAEPLRWRLKPGDMLVAISSSGKSPNILQAARVAAQQGGLVVTLSAMSPHNPLRTLGSLNFYVQANTYGLAETCHAAILHYWVDQMVESRMADSA
jgi:D-sedoheptulose 7-phosphate isomerase